MISERPWSLILHKRSIRIISKYGSEVACINLSQYTDNTRHIDDANFIVEVVNRVAKAEPAQGEDEHGI